MPSDFNTAVLIMAVGMTTVFVILSLVVLTGRLLIRLVNHFAVDPSPEKIYEAVSLASVNSQDHHSIAPKTLAAIIATVEQITEGKGRIEKIEPKP